MLSCSSLASSRYYRASRVEVTTSPLRNRPTRYCCAPTLHKKNVCKKRASKRWGQAPDSVSINLNAKFGQQSIRNLLPVFVLQAMRRCKRFKLQCGLQQQDPTSDFESELLLFIFRRTACTTESARMRTWIKFRDVPSASPPSL